MYYNSCYCCCCFSLIKNFKDFEKNCRSYFMEIVSTLCFGGQNAPDSDLIKMLMQLIFTENKKSGLTTQDLTPLGHKDKTPVVRSSLLQLLLEHKYACIVVMPVYM